MYRNSQNNRLMKKSLLLACMAVSAMGAAAQNVQFHYDFGRNLYNDLKRTSESDGRAPITTTVEMFRGDTWGSTYFFIDLDYNSGMKGGLLGDLSRDMLLEGVEDGMAVGTCRV